MSSHYQVCKNSIYRYREKNAEKFKEYYSNYYKKTNWYRYKKELQEFMNILLDDDEKKPTYYQQNKEKILEKRKLYYQKKKSEKV
jgi:hypothetical protein